MGSYRKEKKKDLTVKSKFLGLGDNNYAPKMGSLNRQRPADILSHRLEMHEEQNNVSCSLRGEGGRGGHCVFLPLCAAGPNSDDSLTARQAKAHCRRTAPSSVRWSDMEKKEDRGFQNQKRGEGNKIKKK